MEDKQVKQAIEQEMSKRSRTRPLIGFWAKVVMIIAIGLSFFQLYFNIALPPSPIFFRSIHVMLALVLIFLMYPVQKKPWAMKINVLDILCVLISIGSGVYIIWAYEDLMWRMGEFYWYEIPLGAAALLMVLEATRRAVGPPLAIIGVLFLLYCMFGNYSPIFAHQGFDVERIVSQLYLAMEGIYGMPIGVMTSFVFLFIIFSAFLRRTGAGDFLIDLSFALMGRMIGGPAKAAAVASGFFGSISGSITANVVGTGAITIPMMKRLGYKREFAGAVEVSASTGGQMMPPIMGAGAFIMAEWTGLDYFHIVAMSVVPAVLFYLSVISFIHFNALKMGIGKVDPKDVPNLRETLKKGWHFFIPILVLLFLLIQGRTPMFAAIWGIATILVVHLISGLVRRDEGWTLGGFLKKYTLDFFDSLETGAKGAVVVMAAMACAGIIVGAVGLTGMGLRISNSLISITEGSLFLTLVFVALASLIMGMEMPVTASYIIVAVLAVPALKTLGLPILAAHLIVFWFSQDAAVTPPVCLSSYAAAAISGGNPFKTGIQAWKLAKGLYIMPFLFAYTALVSGTWWEIMQVGLMASIAFLCFAAAWEGHFYRPVAKWEQGLLAACSLLCLIPDYASYLTGLLVFAFILFRQFRKSPQASTITT